MPTSASTALRLALVVSLALNLFAAGWFAGNLWRHEGPGKRWHHSRLDPRALHDALEGSDREKLEAAMPAHRKQIHERLRELRAARGAVAGALRAEPFDPQRLATAFDQLREREAAVANQAQRTLIGLASQLSPEGREKMARQMIKRKRHRKADGDDREPGPALSR